MLNGCGGRIATDAAVKLDGDGASNRSLNPVGGWPNVLPLIYFYLRAKYFCYFLPKNDIIY